jgi:mRNA deadenylase 3'-5' endonuclease subunit Ccr4
MYREVREKLNMAVFAHLKHIDSGRELTIVSSHLYWDPAYPDIKLLQAYMLAQECFEISPTQPIVVGADLNSIPQSSGVYELLMGSGKVPITHPDHPVTIRRSKNGNLEGVSPDAVPDLINPKPFTSAMKLLLGNEPVFTNYTSTFKGCLDYVMTRGDLRVIGGDKLPDESELAKEVALPNSIYPSDHLPITVDLEFI